VLSLAACQWHGIAKPQQAARGSCASLRLTEQLRQCRQNTTHVGSHEMARTHKGGWPRRTLGRQKRRSLLPAVCRRMRAPSLSWQLRGGRVPLTLEFLWERHRSRLVTVLSLLLVLQTIFVDGLASFTIQQPECVAHHDHDVCGCCRTAVASQARQRPRPSRSCSFALRQDSRACVLLVIVDDIRGS